MKIKAGYRIEVVTWENDADNYKTRDIDGLSEDEAVEIVKYLKLFKKSEWDGGLGNAYNPDDEFIQEYTETLQKLYEENKATWDNLLGVEEGEIEDFSEWVAGCVGHELGVHGGDFFTRVVEEFTISYTPVEIVLEDVSEKFK